MMTGSLGTPRAGFWVLGETKPFSRGYYFVLEVDLFDARKYCQGEVVFVVGSLVVLSGRFGNRVSWTLIVCLGGRLRRDAGGVECLRHTT